MKKVKVAYEMISIEDLYGDTFTETQMMWKNNSLLN